MSVFRTATTPQQRIIDPLKRVKYSLGLVLGVDEFEQEQGYFLERGRLENRLLHGYGTVYGLKVDGDANQLSVAPGLAVDPLGREIRVGQAQCASLTEWLTNPDNHPDVDVPTTLTLYVLLGYRECETDKVPVPGAPCRSEDENLVPSRITESFDLKFSLSLPNQHEEAAVEAFGELLRRIEVTDDYDGATVTPDDAAALVNAIDRERVSRPIRKEPIEGRIDWSPVRDNTLRVRSDDIEAVLDAMFRVWVTEVRPRILTEQTGPNATPADQSVLLARLTVTVDAGWKAGTVTIHEEERPYLLHTRLIQEYLINREQSRDHDQLEGLGHDDHPQYLLVSPEDRSLIADLNAAGHKVIGLAQAMQNGDAVPFEQAVKDGDHAGGDVVGTYPDRLMVRGIMRVPVAEQRPDKGDHLIFNGDVWAPAASPPGVTQHSQLQGLANDDHTQYLLANGQRALSGNLNANRQRIINLSQSVADGDPIVRGEAATGDLNGRYPAPTVVRLQGNPVDAAKPAAAGQVLTWDGAQWTGKPFSVLNPVATQLPALPFVSIARIPSLSGAGPAFRLWFHLDAGLPKLSTDLPVLREGFDVIPNGEMVDKSGQPYLMQMQVLSLKPEPDRLNVFDLDLGGVEIEPENFRFAFPIESMKLATGMPLIEYYSARNIKYLGHDGKGLITAFWSARTGVDLSGPRQILSGAVGSKGEVLFGNFTCEVTLDPATGTATNYLIRFDKWQADAKYAVTAIPINPGNLDTLPVICCVQNPTLGLPGIVLQPRRTDTMRPAPASFMFHVTELPQRQ